MPSTRLASGVIALLALSGCFTHRAYVDAKLPSVKYSDLSPLPAPAPIAVEVTFLSNGSPNEKGQDYVQQRVIKCLEGSGLFAKVDAGAASSGEGVLKIVMENIPSSGAAGKGFLTGLTLGIVGSTVTDQYDFKATYQGGSGAPIEKHYQHAIYTTIGHASMPGLTPMSTEEAVNQVVEQLTLNTLQDLQRDGVLVAPPKVVPPAGSGKGRAARAPRSHSGPEVRER